MSPVKPIEKADVRTRILETVGRLFHSQGYHATGINQVIAEAKVAKASFYQYFPSKMDLLLEYLLRHQAMVMAEWQVAMEGCSDPKEKIMELFECRIRRQLRMNFCGCAFVKINAELTQDHEDVFKLVLEHKQLLKKKISGLLKEIKEYSVSELNEKTELVYLLYEGGGVESSIQRNISGLKTAMKIVATQL
jgi:AcrR family transcriptional regulator